MADPTPIQQAKHKRELDICMKYSGIETLNGLLAEIEREDYQTVEGVKNSIKGHLAELHAEVKNV